MTKKKIDIDNAIADFEQNYQKMPITQLMQFSKDLYNSYDIKTYFMEKYDISLSALQAGKIKQQFQKYCLEHFSF